MATLPPPVQVRRGTGPRQAIGSHPPSPAVNGSVDRASPEGDTNVPPEKAREAKMSNIADADSEIGGDASLLDVGLLADRVSLALACLLKQGKQYQFPEPVHAEAKAYLRAAHKHYSVPPAIQPSSSPHFDVIDEALTVLKTNSLVPATTAPEELCGRAIRSMDAILLPRGESPIGDIELLREFFELVSAISSRSFPRDTHMGGYRISVR